MEIQDDILIVKIDLKKDFGKSSSGKSIMIASTQGNTNVLESDFKIGINCYKKG